MKNLRENIGWSRIKRLVSETAGLDNMKDMGYKFAFKGGLSFSLGDIKNSDQTTINRRCQNTS
jgi:DNA-directed RNA polymerase subunit beta'